MSETIKLVRCLGFPLINDGSPSEFHESESLLELAFKNGVELIYLRNLDRAGKLDKLRPRLHEYEERRLKSAECIKRIAKAMDKLQMPYAITKTLRPYPATPNDTDLLYLGPLDEYVDAVRRFETTGFVRAEAIKLQTEFFDPQGGEIYHRDKRGGKFYIDFYRQLAADHMPYMNSARLLERVRTTMLDDVKVNVFDPIAEMTILYLHSVIMHRTFPLEVFWSTAYWLKDMDDAEMDKFAAFIRSHHAVISARSAFGLMAALCQETYGEIPAKIQGMIDRMGARKAEQREFAVQQASTPHIARFSTWTFAVLEKTLEWNSMRGFLKELVMMINPLFFAEVMHHMFSRKRIRKHSAHV